MAVGLVLACLAALPSYGQSDLRVSDNGRFLVHEDGSPFFYLGDTAWELFHRLDRKEAVKYLRNRAEKGFTVIQAVVLAEHKGLRDPNAYGELPLIDDDPRKPNERYFEHVDFIVDQAEALGLYVALLPTWGDKVYKDKWGAGPVVFDPENAHAYGKYIGARYSDRHNIIWVIGGDRDPRAETDDVAIWRAMARGVEEAAGGDENALMTFHSQSTSARWFHNDDWLDFNMLQTSHCAHTAVWDRIAHDYRREPVKPTMDGEPMYEEIPVCFNLEKNGYADPHDIRRKAYLSLFAGAHGHTYGCNNIWQMYAPERPPQIEATAFWYDSLDLPGANAMTHVRKLMESRPMLDRVPDQSLVVSTAEGYKERVQATRGRRYAFFYSSSGLPFDVRMGKISGRRVMASWYNPRTGEFDTFGTYDNEGTRTFTPPSQGNAHDWVLVLDDATVEEKAKRRSGPRRR